MTNTPRPTRFAGESWRTASAMHARVVGAVIMRDLQTRFGTGYFGFLLGLIMPLGHLTIAMIAMTTLGRPAPIGLNIPTFLLTGILPFVLWLYAHRQIMMSLQQNKPLLYFPGVDIFDLFTARLIIEVASGTLVVLILLSALSLIGYDIRPNNIFGFVYGLTQAWALGIATGLIFGNIGSLWPFFLMLGNLMAPIFWVTSGILYIPDTLPDKVRAVISHFPLSQIVDGVRSSFFAEYTSNYYQPQIAIVTILTLIMFGLSLMFIIRRIT
ncbi:ABC transporter permease [Xanthobacter versatilis]|uniref:ABC transporter permease n=1 Tax=Xanthobacter autotrophicus (strain ATCC BAA-1158 / Py2) TaxID=78245 RepID=UPI00372B23A6